MLSWSGFGTKTGFTTFYQTELMIG